MDEKLKEFTLYLKNTKKRTSNTIDSYKRDISGMYEYMRNNEIYDLDRITYTNINSYILHMEKEGKSPLSITRAISSMKTFFHFLLLRGYIKGEPTELVTAPKIVKKDRKQSSKEVTDKLISNINGNAPITLRDKAMILLMTDTGMRVGEITGILITDINLNMGYINCRNSNTEKTYTISQNVNKVLREYINSGRDYLLKGESQYLFLSYRGERLTRQGFWKKIKEYGKKAGLIGQISPETLRKQEVK